MRKKSIVSTFSLLIILFTLAPLLQAEISLLSTFEKENITESNNFGQNIYQCGDLNGDGYDDIAINKRISERVSFDDYNLMNRLHIYLGNSSIDTEPDIIIEHQNYNTSLNSDLAIACNGNLNGDGYDDIIVVVNQTMYIYLGGKNFNNIPDKTYQFETEAYLPVI